jgi:dTDP-4-dehydrorhamnose reductase
MKIFVCGSKGQLGQAIIKACKIKQIPFAEADLPEIDITSPHSIETNVNQTQPSIIVNAAAYTQVDKAEKESELAFAINRDGSHNLAQICNKRGIPLIHISTDYVFDGENKTPYVETDPINPTGVYGLSKADGEIVIQKQLQQHIIVRTAWLYGLHGQNFIKTMLRLGREKTTLGVVNDQYGCPTCAEDLAQALIQIIQTINQNAEISWGTYHYCGQGITTWYEFATTLFDYVRDLIPLSIETVTPLTTAEYPTPAKRPAYSALDCRRIQEVFKITPRPWQESLKETVERIINQME